MRRVTVELYYDVTLQDTPRHFIAIHSFKWLSTAPVGRVFEPEGSDYKEGELKFDDIAFRRSFAVGEGGYAFFARELKADKSPNMIVYDSGVRSFTFDPVKRLVSFVQRAYPSDIFIMTLPLDRVHEDRHFIEITWEKTGLSLRVDKHFDRVTIPSKEKK